MTSKHTPTFIHELKLNPNKSEQKVLSIRLDVGRQIYNVCLGEALKRLKLMRQSKLYQRAIKQPINLKKPKGKLIKNKERSSLFKQAREKYLFGEYDLHKYLSKKYSGTWLTQHIDSLVAQKLASRAFKAVEEYAYGKHGRPRFRAKRRFSSVEGKNNLSGLRFLNSKIIWSAKGGSKLSLTPCYDKKDKDGLEAYALSQRTKYVRLVCKYIKGQPAWYAQLIQEGTPYIKAKNKINREEIVGLDIGPSTIAIVGSNKACLQPFAKKTISYHIEIKKLQKKMARSLRAMNLNNFNAEKLKLTPSGKKIKKQGTVKPGHKVWHYSKRYQHMRITLSELQRKMAASRNGEHGELVNRILSLGNIVKTEKLSYKSFQKNFGKSVGNRAPGLFMEKLRRKAESAGGQVIEFNTRTTALSQSCQCGAKHKKKLNERWHKCSACGVNAQRDLYSAYLARFVKENRLDTSQALESWAGAGALLEQAVSDLNKVAIGKFRLASFGLGQRQSGLPAKVESMQNNALDVVAHT